jgi:hypothetical protein
MNNSSALNMRLLLHVSGKLWLQEESKYLISPAPRFLFFFLLKIVEFSRFTLL